MGVTFSNHVVEIEKHLRMIASTVRRRGRMLLEQYHMTPPQFDALVILDWGWRVDHRGLEQPPLSCV